MTNIMQHIYGTVEDIEREGHRVLYMVKFGSHLYGTSRPESDTDLKGIFLPSKVSCLLGEPKKHFTSKTGDNNSKNTADDVDIQLWSLQYWLDLVRKGETNAIDLLFSHTYPEMIMYDTGELKRAFTYHHGLFTAKDCNSYIGYAIGQARKYGVKGSRMGAIKRVLEYLDHLTSDWHDSKIEFFVDTRLKNVSEGLLDNCGDASYCFLKELKGPNGELKSYLVLCGSKHDLDITLEEFYNRVKKAYDTYGERAKMAEQNQGIDWKALSHAVRSIDQMRELLASGKIKYPLKTAQKLLDIKRGVFSWKDVETMITDGLEEINRLQTESPTFHQYDPMFVESLVLSLY